jgi:hypothetical protein
MAFLALAGCAEARLGSNADRFLADYTARYQTLRIDASLADWASNTRIVEGDSTNAVRSRQANEALLAPGGTRPWRAVLRETTGRDLDGKAVAEYFEPLRLWLVEQNRGRTHTLPETL